MKRVVGGEEKNLTHMSTISYVNVKLNTFTQEIAYKIIRRNINFNIQRSERFLRGRVKYPYTYVYVKVLRDTNAETNFMYYSLGSNAK